MASSDVIDISDRVFANKWFTRLRDFNKQSEDLKGRNKILAAMVLQMQIGSLTVPFNYFPTFKNLSEVQVAEFTAENILPDDFKLPPSATNPGAFMVSPVPQCGAYCYMAVITKPRDRDKEK